MTNSSTFQIENFSLDQMMVLIHHKELGNSSNKPVLTTCVNVTSGDKEDIVVKLLASERMSADACMKECIASLMWLFRSDHASVFGVMVPL